MGFPKLKGMDNDIPIYQPHKLSDGWYNHAAMLYYHNGTITVSWKNAPETEDTPGQRVLYSQSSDGVQWSKAALLFPNMSTNAVPVAQFAGPFAVLNGKLYASATPALVNDGDAQGGQFCLWPDGLDPRNCATPDRPGTQPSGLLMLREVGGLDLQGGGASPPYLGDVFWASHNPPAILAPAATANRIKTPNQMDAATQADLKKLVGNGAGAGFTPPCAAPSSGTLKCEGCLGGCQEYDAPGTKGLGLANERTHYPVPSSTPDSIEDVILFRAHSNTLWASTRTHRAPGGTPGTPGNWSQVVETTIPNDNSNLNAGVLPDGNGVFLLSNAAPAKVRDPLTISLSADGYNFSKCMTVQTCTAMAGGKSNCKARQPGGVNKNVGPSYPQGLSVVHPAAEAVQGLYVVATNNKEDVVITRIPWAALAV